MIKVYNLFLFFSGIKPFTCPYLKSFFSPVYVFHFVHLLATENK